MNSILALLLIAGAPQAEEAPMPRNGHAFVYDDERRMLLTFGGVRPSRTPPHFPPATLWGWDGDRWRALSSNGPSRRSDYQFAWDSKRKVAVLYGGTFQEQRGGRWESTNFTDTWEWNGQSWKEVQTPNNPGRLSHSCAAFDPASGRVVLFSGHDHATDKLSRDTWLYDGKDWKLRRRTGPPPRFMHAMAYSPKNKAVLLFGGADFQGTRSDTWMWVGDKWTEVAAGPPREGIRGGMTPGPDGNVYLVGGGVRGTLLNDLWRWDGQAWTQVSERTPMPARSEHAVGFDPARDRLVVFGGSGPRAALGDLWEWDGSSWQNR